MGGGPFPLRLQRAYNSVRAGVERPGADWRHWYQRNIVADPTVTGAEAEVYRADGKVLTFTFGVSGWTSDPDVRERLEEELNDIGGRSGWRLTDANDSNEEYDALGRLIAVTNREGFTQTLAYDDASGLLQSVTGPFGRTLSFTHDGNGRLESVTDPAGNVYEYVHESDGNLVAVIYPDNSSRVYHYENTQFPYHLTGITNENGQRFATWTYDARGRATSSERAGGANKITITYNANGTSTVTDALGNETVYTVEAIFGVRRTTEFDQPCALCQNKNAANSYDENGFLASTKDFNNNVTTFEFDERGLERSRTEAQGKAGERTVTTEWHPVFRRPVKITEPGRETAFIYDDMVGRLLTRTVTDLTTTASVSRITTRAYTDGADGEPAGLLESIDGPRPGALDLTTFEYDAAGNLIKTTNALGHETKVTAYDAHGRPLTIEDPNGTKTDLQYDTRGRLLSRIVYSIQITDGSQTTFDYDSVGNVVRVTLPDGSFITQEYDAANRLIAIADNLGNRVAYTLDALGNRIKEETFDPGGNLADPADDVLTRGRERVYNLLNRLITEIGGEGQSTDFTYDLEGNLLSVTDPNIRKTKFTYDPLNRLVKSIAPDDGETDFRYDQRDNLVSVVDPRRLETTYTYNGFNEVIETSSPDTGLTIQSYDEAGNRLSSTDARLIMASFEYDVLNRLTAIHYPDPSEDVTFDYDQGPNGIGRLTRIIDQAGVIHMAYDPRGNLVSEIRIIDGLAYTTGYAYDAADRLVQMTYPSGLVVSYERDSLGRVSSVNAIKDGETRPVASGLNYAPFGPLTALTFGNGIQMTRALDDDYRLRAQQAGAVQDLTFDYDPASNIVGLLDGVNPTRDQSFGYDGVNRLTSAQGGYGAREYVYDKVGNRETRSADGAADTYTYSSSANQLASIAGPNAESFVYDEAGNTIQKGPSTYIYNNANRLESVQASGQVIAKYVYNAKGERVKKVVAGETMIFHYDQAGNLLAEFDGQGNPLRDYIWLDGERLAIVAGGPDVTFTGANPQSGAQITLGLFLEDKVVEIKNGDGKFEQYTLTAKEWTVSEKGELKLKFDGESIQFKGKLAIDTLEGTMKLRTDGAWEAYELTGAGGGTASLQGLFFIHSDHLGTPKVITDESQEVVWEASYTPFGTALIAVNKLENNLRFPGQYFDEETGLHYNVHRYNSAIIGRYLSSDRIGLDGGVNTYTYALANPVRFKDSTGLKVEFICRPLDLSDRAPKHCFIYVTCPEESWSRVLSLFGDSNTGLIFPSQGYKYSYDPMTPSPGGDGPDAGRDDPDSARVTSRHVVPKPSGCNQQQCGFEKTIIESYNDFPWGKVPYRVLGPNSNTFARDLVGGFIPPGVDAPGIRYGLPVPPVPAIGP